MKVLISGSTGFVGSAVVAFGKQQGWDITRLVRSSGSTKENQILWSPQSGQIDKEKLENFDTVIHLAGESIAQGRWTEAKKARICDSRIQGTSLLSQTLAQLEKPPSTVISASAVGVYGNRNDSILTEQSSSGTGFLAEVGKIWEASTVPLQEKNIRVIHLRLGVILGKNGGALSKMLLPFKMGVGGIIGNGKQYMSWIMLDDVVQIISFLLQHKEIKGPVNAVSPYPVTNKEFTKTLAKVLSRPAIFPLPAFSARLIFGEMADETLLASNRVIPEVLQQSGYEFLYPDLEQALRSLIK